MIGTTFTLLLLCWVPGTLSLETGPINAWLEQTFCTGENDYVNLPWDCAGFIHCEIGHSHWMNCGFGQQFDAVSKTCLLSSTTCGNAEEAAATFCPNFRQLKFAHPKNCAMYYDCSKTTPSPYGLKIYEEECPFPMLFDHKIMDCRNQDPKNPVPCTNVPTTRCDYVKECGNTTPTDVCSAVADGMYPDPQGVFLPSFILCTGGVDTGPFNCNPGEIFDPLTRECIMDFKDAMSNYCRQNPTAIFSDPLLCSMYFNCSKIEHHSDILKQDYQTECHYLYLFDVGTKSCRRFDQMTIPCGFRSEPKAPCEYRVSDCAAGGSCLPCTANCTGLPDGHNPYPGYPNTRFHVLCEGERTLDIKQCPSPLIFLPGLRVCGNEGEDGTTTPSAVTDPVVTEPATDPPTPSPTDPPIPTDPPTTIPMPTVPPLTEPIPTDPPPTDPPPTEPPPTTPPPPVCTMTPVCDAELALVMGNITMLTDDMLDLTGIVNKKLADPYGCKTPPTIEHGHVQISFTKTHAIATYRCATGYIFCGPNPTAKCQTDNVWVPVEGFCAKSVFEDITGDIVIKCLHRPTTVIIRGRQTEEEFKISLRNEDGRIIELDYAGESVKFGPQSLQARSPLPHPLENLHEWRLHFDEDVFLRLDGEEIADRGYTLRVYEDVIVEFTGGYLPEIVMIEGKDDQPFLEIEPVDVNLAYRMPVEVSSTTDGTYLAALTDGRNVIGPGTCWATQPDDNAPFLVINLQQEYSVSRVVLTLPNCTEASWCVGQVVGFVVLVGGDFCGANEDTDPESPILDIKCNTPLTGRVVSFEGFSFQGASHLAFCEVEVYGGLIVGKKGGKSTPFDCPDPPLLDDATVRVEYTDDKAIAVYTCSPSHVSCVKDNIIRCTGQRGWESTPKTCIPSVARDVSSMQLCPMRVGTGIELFITPTIDIFDIAITNGEAYDIILFELNLKDTQLHINDILVSQTSPLFKLGEESRIMITFFSIIFIVTMDGKEIFRQGYSYEDGMGLSYRNAESATAITKAVIHSSADVAYEKINLPGVVGNRLSASSSLHSAPGVAGYGVPVQYASCWTSGVGDHAPWLEADLGGQFSIESISFATEACQDCTGDMVASGSTAAAGQPADLIDDDGGDNSCFKSSVSEPYWIVDTKGLYGIIDVELIGHTETASDFGDFEILLYAEDPIANAAAESVTCATQTGTVGEITMKYTCSSPTDFRFLKIAKTAATPLHLCEVIITKFGNTMLKNFKVTVHDRPGSQPKLCYEQKDKDIDPSSTTVVCGEPTTGQHVRLTKQSDGYLDVLQICSISVSGFAIIEKEWTPYNCPKPPLSDSSYVSLSWNANYAVATYKCKNGFYNYDYVETMQCKDINGWDLKATPCAPGLFTGTPNIMERSLRLGEAIEVYFTPTSNRNFISTGEDSIEVQIEIDTGLIIFVLGVTGVEQKFDLKLNQENRYVITLLTTGVELDVDGIFIGRVPVSLPLVIVVNPPEGLRYAHILPVAETVAYKRGLVNELPLMDATVSSSDGNLNGYKAIGAEGTAVMTNCWVAAPEEDPNIFIRMDMLYFVDRVEIDTRSDCGADDVCKQRTHDLDIRVYHTSVAGETPQFCAYHKEAITAPTGVIKCERHVTGMYVKITGLNRRGQEDAFTICEVRVFGGEIIRNPKDNPFINLPIDPCPTMDGYISVESPRLCYRLSSPTTLKSHSDAEVDCGVDNHLIDLDTQQKTEYIINVLTNLGNAAQDPSGTVQFHVGLTKVDTTWTWNSGGSYVHWQGGAQNDNVSCGSIVLGGMDGLDCAILRRYICEVPMTKQPPVEDVPELM